MHLKKIAQNYLSALEAGDYEKVIQLFSKDAVVYSPLYGKQDAALFYKDLFADTQQSKITLLNIFTDENNLKAAIHFNYEWILKDGVAAPFEVVDIMEFTPQQEIISLKIIYDTQQTREKFYKATVK